MVNEVVDRADIIGEVACHRLTPTLCSSKHVVYVLQWSTILTCAPHCKKPSQTIPKVATSTRSSRMQIGHLRANNLDGHHRGVKPLLPFVSYFCFSFELALGFPPGLLRVIVSFLLFLLPVLSCTIFSLASTFSPQFFDLVLFVSRPFIGPNAGRIQNPNQWSFGETLETQSHHLATTPPYPKDNKTPNIHYSFVEQEETLVEH
ncbi:hypothetical protein CR513_43437, partial [Mucuna pruriens]